METFGLTAVEVCSPVQDFLKDENDSLVEELAARDRQAGVEGFARGVEACQLEIRAQVWHSSSAITMSS